MTTHPDQVLVVTRGLPGAGKSTRAKAWLEDDPDRRARVNRDILRDMLANGRHGDPPTEEKVNLTQRAAVHALLATGHSVIVDDTNLRDSEIDTWSTVAASHGVQLEVMDLRHIPVEVCVQRNAARPHTPGRRDGARVGEHEIHAAHQRMNQVGDADDRDAVR